MAFFEELTKKAQAYAGVAAEKAQAYAGAAAEKAKEVKDTTKANMDIAAEKREIEKNYRAIGEWFVETYLDEPENAPDAIKDVIAAIAASKAKIAELEAAKPKKEETAVEAEAVEEVVAEEAPAEEPVEE